MICCPCGVVLETPTIEKMIFLSSDMFELIFHKDNSTKQVKQNKSELSQLLILLFEKIVTDSFVDFIIA